MQAHDACRDLVFDAMEETLMIARGYRDQGSAKTPKKNESATASPAKRCHELTTSMGGIRGQRVEETNP